MLLTVLSASWWGLERADYGGTRSILAPRPACWAGVLLGPRVGGQQGLAARFPSAPSLGARLRATQQEHLCVGGEDGFLPLWGIDPVAHSEGEFCLREACTSRQLVSASCTGQAGNVSWTKRWRLGPAAFFNLTVAHSNDDDNNNNNKILCFLQ